MKTKRAIRIGEELNKKLLDHEFNCTDVFTERYSNAKIVARHYCQAENAVAVLSNMPLDTSYICYGHLGEKLNLGNGIEESANLRSTFRVCSQCANARFWRTSAVANQANR